MSKKTTNQEPYVIIRGKNVGVHAGYLHKDARNRMVLRDAIRLWKWSGAASLSELAVYGPARPESCKFGVPIPTHELRGLDDMGDYEVIHCTFAATAAIQAVPSWRA